VVSVHEQSSRSTASLSAAGRLIVLPTLLFWSCKGSTRTDGCGRIETKDTIIYVDCFPESGGALVLGAEGATLKDCPGSPTMLLRVIAVDGGIDVVCGARIVVVQTEGDGRAVVRKVDRLDRTRRMVVQRASLGTAPELTSQVGTRAKLADSGWFYVPR
jgi:hypothetical protein